jgi:hypothetical protein
MTTHLGLQRILLPSAQVSQLTTGSITLPSARGAFSTPGDFESIATSTGTSSAIVTFNSIPADYKHLQLRCLIRDSRSATANTLRIYFNNSESADYAYGIAGWDGTKSAGVGVAQNNAVGGVHTSTNASANFYGWAIITILDYKNTSKKKSLKTEYGYNLNGSGYAQWGNGLWNSTAAITRIDFANNAGSNFLANSHFALYGIKG